MATSVGISDDYASVITDSTAYYYGYEHSICLECKQKNKGEFCEDHESADREWCFVATVDGNETVIPFSELPHDDMFGVSECLALGMAIYHDKLAGK